MNTIINLILNNSILITDYILVFTKLKISNIIQLY